MRRIAGSVALALAAAQPLAAQASAYVVKDINVTSATNLRSSSPNNFTPFGSRVVFAATTPIQGAELWSTDGTAAGTSMIADIFRGSSSSYPQNFVVLNGSLLFTAQDNRGAELWVTDGTTEGTRLLADINSAGSSSPGRGIVYHNRLIFPATDPVDGRELWITDGTPAGTRLLKDIVPGTSWSEPEAFAVFNDRVYFAAAGALWKSDGTESGTVKVATVSANGLTVAGSRLFFNGYTESSGQEVWVSDGTESGTQAIELIPGKESAVAYRALLTPLGGRALFVADDGVHGRELWTSDGTAAGTRMVRDIVPGKGGGLSRWSWELAVLGGFAFFGADDGTHGMELWRTDGTESGTTLVRDLVPGKDSSEVYALTVMGGKVFFLSLGSSQRWSICSSDGTEQGTRVIGSSNIDVHTESGPPLTPIDGTLYFAGSNPLTGFEPWKTDGTGAGTGMIANLASDPAPGSEPRTLFGAGDQLFFEAWDGIGTITSNGGESRSLWRSDGTPEGTVKLTTTLTFSYFSLGSSVLFTGSGSGVFWMSDGTPEGTHPATEFMKRFPPSPNFLFTLGDTIFFTAAKSSEYVLFATTAAPDAPVVALGPKSASSFVEVAGRAVFIGDAGLWTSDGTPEGTYPIVPALSGIGPLTMMGGNVYFGRQNSGLWKSDGTFEGTVAVTNTPNTIGKLVVAGSRLFFSGGGQLWVTDGNVSRALGATVQESSTNTFAAAAERVVFTATDATNGAELWVSDGTPEGTRILRDINPGTVGSGASELFADGGVVYFRAFDNLNGSELWSTDGTAEGTHLAVDAEPGSGSSFARQFTRAGNYLFFTATTTTTGNELWALPLPSAPRLSIGDVRVAEGDSGTSTARFAVTLAPPAATGVTVDFATTDATAATGADYDAASGTLTFAPGETSKTIEVRILGDAATENNETFLVTLRNAAGAALAKPAAFAIIEDDDQFADISAALDLSLWSNYDIRVNATNNGPRTATGLKVTGTATPATTGASTCASCQVGPGQLAPGATIPAYGYRWFGFPQFLTATVTARQRDAQPSNNRVAWMTNAAMAMDAHFLTPGSQATGWLYIPQTVASVNLESSNPSVISVPATLANSSPDKGTTFIVRGIGVGTATIRAYVAATTYGALTINVVAAGTTVRFPGAVDAYPQANSIPFDQQARFNINATATAPFNGQRATGLFTISAKGQELGRVTLAPGDSQKTVMAYLPDVGAITIIFDYAGDANFLPEKRTWDMTVTPGSATILGTADKTSPTTAAVHVRVNGSPMAAPTGTVTVSVPGSNVPAQTVPLTAGASGVGQAEIVLSNIPAGVKKVTVSYSGDARYKVSKQDFGLRETRGRAVRH